MKEYFTVSVISSSVSMAYSAIKPTSDRQMGIPIHIIVSSHTIFMPHLSYYPYWVQSLQYPKQQDYQPETALAELSCDILEALGHHSSCCFAAIVSTPEKITYLPGIHFLYCWLGGCWGVVFLKKILLFYIASSAWTEGYTIVRNFCHLKVR